MNFQGCETRSILNDVYCDDNANTFECNYDRGDCCGSNVSIEYCNECVCYWDIGCETPTLKGNGFCNDESNNANCNFDGGDCCGECINTDLCSECVCHEEAVPEIDHSCK